MLKKLVKRLLPKGAWTRVDENSTTSYRGSCYGRCSSEITVEGDTGGKKIRVILIWTGKHTAYIARKDDEGLLVFTKEAIRQGQAIAVPKMKNETTWFMASTLFVEKTENHRRKNLLELDRELPERKVPRNILKV